MRDSEFKRRINQAHLANGFLESSEIESMIEVADKEFPETEIWEKLHLILSADLMAEIMKEVRQYFDWRDKWFGNILDDYKSSNVTESTEKGGNKA